MDRGIAVLSVTAVSIIVFYISGKTLGAFSFLDEMKLMDKKASA
jgi:hypothetical protein